MYYNIIIIVHIISNSIKLHYTYYTGKVLVEKRLWTSATLDSKSSEEWTWGVVKTGGDQISSSPCFLHFWNYLCLVQQLIMIIVSMLCMKLADERDAGLESPPPGGPGSSAAAWRTLSFFSEQRTQRSVSVVRPNSSYISPSAIGPVASLSLSIYIYIHTHM